MIKARKISFGILFLLLLSVLDVLQAQDLPVEKVLYKPALWTTLTIPVVLNDKAHLQFLLERRQEFQFTQQPNFQSPLLAQGYYTRGNNQWQWMLGGRLFRDGNSYLRDAIGGLRHMGKLKAWQFEQELCFDWRESAQVLQRFPRLRAGLKVHRSLQEGTQRLTFAYFALKNYPQLVGVQVQGFRRFFSSSRLVLNYELLLKKRFDLNFFLMHRTDYFIALAQFEEDGLGNIVEVKPDRRLNIIRPSVGVILSLHLGRARPNSSNSYWWVQ